MSAPSIAVPDDLDPPDHEERITYARGVALWELGDPSWADTLIDAYLHPSAVPDAFCPPVPDEETPE